MLHTLTLTEPETDTLRHLLLDCLTALDGNAGRAAAVSPEARHDVARRKVLCERLLWELDAGAGHAPDRKAACAGTGCRAGARLNGAEVEAYQARLRATAARLGGTVTALENEARRPTASALDTAEEAAARALFEAEGSSLAEVTAALDRIDRGTFGRCEGCGKAVSKSRLNALPHTRYCAACAHTV